MLDIPFVVKELLIIYVDLDRGNGNIHFYLLPYHVPLEFSSIKIKEYYFSRVITYGEMKIGVCDLQVDLETPTVIPSFRPTMVIDEYGSVYYDDSLHGGCFSELIEVLRQSENVKEVTDEMRVFIHKFYENCSSSVIRDACEFMSISSQAEHCAHA